MIELNSVSFLHIVLSLIIKMTFILSSISRGLEFWSVNHTSICKNSESNVLENTKFSGEICQNWPNALLGTIVYKALEFC